MLAVALVLASLDAVTSLLKEHWSIFPAIIAAVSAGVGIYKALGDLRRSRREDAERRKAAKLEEGHCQWTEELLKPQRLFNQPVRVFLHDREHLEWAVNNRRLRVVEEFEGGWMVVENRKLGDSPRMAAAS